MKLSEVKTQLTGMEKLSFELPDGTFVPAHFHVTEVGVVDKQFIDCGGTVRREKVASLQLWQANDYDHRLAPQKLLSIIELSERVLEMEDLEVEVEYQADTIGKYKLGMGKNGFALQRQFTDCLAQENCGIPAIKPKARLSELSEACCEPQSGCC
jgi:hypothetical protein